MWHPWLKVPNFLLDNRMMSWSRLNVELVKITEPWRLGHKLEMVALTILKINLLEVMFLH